VSLSAIGVRYNTKIIVFALTREARLPKREAHAPLGEK